MNEIALQFRSFDEQKYNFMQLFSITSRGNDFQLFVNDVVIRQNYSDAL